MSPGKTSQSGYRGRRHVAQVSVMQVTLLQTAPAVGDLTRVLPRPAEL